MIAEGTDISTKILSDIVVYTKYARFLPEKNRRETWEELVDRNKEMHIKKFPDLTEEIESAYKLVYDKKVLPSMRSLQFGGKPIEISPNRIYNCGYAPVDDWRVFSEIMFLLLGGTGVGYSVQRHHVEKLPEIQKPNAKRRRRFLIGDSIEGWADAIKVLMKSYFFGGSKIIFDFSDIRPKGALLVTSGGKAPGPQPLKECIVKIKGILDEKENGEQLSSLEAHDIVCHIADAVLAGGIRRAALISLFSADDHDMISCKTGSWWELNPQRGRANNSAVLLRSRIERNFFDDLWSKMKASGSGEPGIYFTNDKEWGTNPCVEIALRPNQFCVSGDTKLITKDGLETIEKVVGKEIKIWNGEEWSQVKPYQTGKSDRLHRVYFSDGSYLDATDNHKFLVKNRFESSYREMETLELIKAVKEEKYVLSVPRSNIVYSGGKSEPDAYDYGFVLGDGSVRDKYISADLFSEKDKSIEFKTAAVVSKNNKNSFGTDYTRVRFKLDHEFAFDLKYGEGLPKSIFAWDRESIFGFIAGWADADGAVASNGIRVYGTEDKMRDLQLLLSKVGVNSSVNLSQRKGTKTNLGTRRKDLWYVQITKTAEIPCQRLKCDNTEEAKFKGKDQVIRKIETLAGSHKSYCLTEEKLHQCVFNNVLTKQCNLTEINASNVVDQEDFNARCEAASLIGTLQASYTEFHYLRPVWQRTTEKDALIGVSMTGIASNKVKDLDMNEANIHIAETNARIADAIGIRPAARRTCVKPAGTTSLTVGSSSGIHAWHDEYYIRRMRVGKNEAIYGYLAENHPELVEDEFFSPKDTAVISVPQKAPEGATLRSESALDLLERVKYYSRSWVKPGHSNGLNTHNISATVSVKEDEWDDVRDWMWENKTYYNGLSILPYDGGTYTQAPFEKCGKDYYDERIEDLTSIDLTKVVEVFDDTDQKGEIACGPQGCDIT